MNYFELTPLEAGKMIRNKELGVREYIESILKRINVSDKEYNAFVKVYNENVLEKADVIQKRINDGVLDSLLAGVPYGIKDNICTEGIETTCASKILSGFKPPYNATVVELLNHSGLIQIGKTNMDEFAMGSTCETSYYGITKNPWNNKHVPGGSSGGSAAAVAAREVPFAIGSDTGGSIRQPASYCGVTGLKPTYGSVSRFGLIAYGSSLDQIGPIAVTARDCAAIFDEICQPDKMDSTSVGMSGKTLDSIDNGVNGLKIGIPRSYFGDGIDPDVKECVMKAAKLYESEGAVVDEFEFSILDFAVPAYYIIATAEASSNLSRFDGVKYGYRSDNAETLKDIYLKSRTEGFGSEVKKRIMLGAFALSSGYYDAYYNKALQVKTLIKKAFNEAFHQFDLILGPVAPTTAPKLGESLKDPLAMYLSDIYTVAVNLAGLPGISLPCGFDRNGLPVGLQLIGDAFSEPRLLSAANYFQNITDYHKCKPESIKGAE